MTEQVVKSKDLTNQGKDGCFLQTEKYYQKSCKYMHNNSTKQKGKKISTAHRAQLYGDKLPKKVGKP